MKKILIIFFGLLLFNNLSGQTYFPFPNDTAKWDCLTWHQWSPYDINLYNSSYILEGDTILEGKLYKKVYYTDDHIPCFNAGYIGGIREDSNKNIYFFPFLKVLPNISTAFPSDTTEYLLYTFDNLSIGMTLPINEEETVIKVIDIDSILLGDSYRRRYKIQQNNLFPGDHYWIEGIGSNKDLFSSYSSEFEWELYTLCYTDSVIYYINSPNGADSCHYMFPVGIKIAELSSFDVHPNPATNTIHIKTNAAIQNGYINIYNSTGHQIIQKKISASEFDIDIHEIKSGVYIIEFINSDSKRYSKFIKK